MDKLVSQYVTDSMRLCGQLWTPGSQPSPDALTEVTSFLNQLLDGLNSLRNMIYTVSDLTYPLVAGQFQYTIGPAPADLPGPRPQWIERANLIYQTSPTVERRPIQILDVQQWAAILLPELQSAIPVKLYYDSGYSQVNPTGQGVIRLWPAPQSNYELELFIPATLPATLQATDTLFAPPGYARMLTYLLAVEIMDLYPKRLSAERAGRIKTIAEEARTAVASVNAPMPIKSVAPELVKRTGFNWLVSTN